MNFSIDEITNFIFTMPEIIKEEEKEETIEKWEYVTKEEFFEFIDNYPNALHQDFYMDWYSWNDFSDGKKWPESMVAMSMDMYNVETYKIWRGEYETIKTPPASSKAVTYKSIDGKMIKCED